MRGNGRHRPIPLGRIRSVRYGDQGLNYCVEYVTLELLQCTMCCYLISVPKIQLELSNQGVKLYNEMPNPSAPKIKAPTVTNPQNFHLFPQTSHRQNATISLKPHNPTHPKCARRGGKSGGVLVIGSSALLVCI